MFPAHRGALRLSMMKEGISWEDLRALLLVSRRGSMLGASRDLGVAVSTISRRINRLEEQLGVLLLERMVEGCRLTPEGRHFVEASRSFDAALDDSLLQLGNPSKDLTGTISITSGDGFVPFLAHVFRRFREAHPGCSIRYVVDANFQDVTRGEVDLALRTTKLSEPSLVYRLLASLAYGFYVSPLLASRWTQPPALEDATFVGMLPPLDRLPPLLAARQAGMAKEAIVVSTFSAQLEAVKAGLGIGVLPHHATKGLLPLYEEIQLPRVEVFWVTRPQALRQLHIRAFVNELEAVLAEDWGAKAPASAGDL